MGGHEEEEEEEEEEEHREEGRARVPQSEYQFVPAKVAKAAHHTAMNARAAAAAKSQENCRVPPNRHCEAGATPQCHIVIREWEKNHRQQACVRCMPG